MFNFFKKKKNLIDPAPKVITKENESIKTDDLISSAIKLAPNRHKDITLIYLKQSRFNDYMYRCINSITYAGYNGVATKDNSVSGYSSKGSVTINIVPYSYYLENTIKIKNSNTFIVVDDLHLAIPEAKMYAICGEKYEN